VVCATYYASEAAIRMMKPGVKVRWTFRVPMAHSAPHILNSTFAFIL
jgi:hypothetical protein